MPIKTVPLVVKILDLEAEELDIQPLTVKIDPGGKGSGLALVRENVDEKGLIALTVVWMMEPMHRS